MAAENPMDWLRMMSDETVEESERLQASDNLSSLLAAPFPDATRELMKAEILTLLLNTTCPKMQDRFLDLIILLAKRDFPIPWDLISALIASLNAAMQSNATNQVLLVLRLTVSLLETRFNDDVAPAEYRDYYLFFFSPLTRAIKYLCSKLVAATSSEQICLLLGGHQHCCNLVCIFTFQGVPEVVRPEFENLMNYFWVNLFSYKFPDHLPDPSVVKAINSLYATVCGILSSYVDRKEPLFSERYAPGFAEKLVQLIEHSFELSSDFYMFQLSALEFLASVARSDTLYSSFNEQSFRQRLLYDVVVPSLKYTARDTELFFKSYSQYIEAQTTGNETSRRRRACNLLTSLATHHMVDVRRLFKSCLRSSPKKECAFFMAMYLDEYFMSQIISIPDLFTEHIRPVLRDHNSGSMIKATALEVFIEFRHSIPKNIGLPALKDLGNVITCDSQVVRLFAAMGIRSLLEVKIQGQLRYKSSDLYPYIEYLFAKLTLAMDRSNSATNSYLRSCREFIFYF